MVYVVLCRRGHIFRGVYGIHCNARNIDLLLLPELPYDEQTPCAHLGTRDPSNASCFASCELAGRQG